MRWEHPRYGLRKPDSFIPVAEETGVVVPIGRWVLAEARRAASAWQGTHPTGAPVEIAVNFAALHFRGPTLLNDIRRALGVTGLAPEMLTVELSERVALDATYGTATLRDLATLGVRLAIDDFGTGFSGLNALKAAPAHTVKIDRGFIAGLGSDPADLAIVRAIASLAKGMELDVVVEGVETEEQLAILGSLGCERAQGFLFSPPVSADQAAALLDAGPFAIPTIGSA